MRRGLALLQVLLAASAGSARAQDQKPIPVPEPAPPPVIDAPAFKWGGEIKAGYRWSQDQSSSILNSFFLPIGQMKTPDPGGSLEIQHLALTGEGEATPGVFVKFEIRFLDLYNRNPTSTDDTVFVRQAFVRFGDKPDVLAESAGSKFYALAGMAPRFSKQTTRHLESYGLWGTAVGRFEEPQLEVGGALGQHVYARAMVGAGNPLFIRDTNALAGDELSEAPANPKATYQFGFPILYDAKFRDVNVTGHAETGLGLGTRWNFGESAALDVLAWRFSRKLADTARIHGTDYPGELAVLKGAGASIPTIGNDRREWGVNLQAKMRGWRGFGQWVDQDLAGAKRYGLEAEVSHLFTLPAFFAIGDSPFGNWIQPSFRFSWIHNEFAVPIAYPRLAVGWPWKKYDFGLRLGLVRNMDLTVEYTVHQVFRTATLPNLPMKEFLLTLRAGF